MANSVINNVIQEHQDWWVGECGGKQGWFPVNHVELMSEQVVDETTADQGDATPLGSLQKGSVDMMGAYVELVRNDYDTNFPFVLKIFIDANSPPFIVAVRSDQEAKEWHDAIKETAQTASDRVNSSSTKLKA